MRFKVLVSGAVVEGDTPSGHKSVRLPAKRFFHVDDPAEIELLQRSSSVVQATDGDEEDPEEASERERIERELVSQLLAFLGVSDLTAAKARLVLLDETEQALAAANKALAKTESQARLCADLVDILQAHRAEGEGSAETMQRLIRERDEAVAAMAEKKGNDDGADTNPGPQVPDNPVSKSKRQPG